jgi:hypothetical protein
MKIYTKVEYLWDKNLQEYVEVSSEGYDYDGPVALAGGGGQSDNVTQTTTVEPPDIQRPSLQQLFSSADNWLNTPYFDVTQAPAQYNLAIEDYRRAADQIAPYANEVMGMNQRLARGDFLSPATNPAFTEYLDLSNAAITRQLNEGILPNLDLSAAGSGNVGSSRQGIAQGLAVGRGLDAIQLNTAQLTDQAYGRGLQATLGAQALSPSIAGLALTPAQIQQGIGDLTDISANYEDRLLRDRINAYAGLVGGGGYGSNSTMTGPAMERGGLTGALGGAAAGAGIASALGMGASTSPWVIGGLALAGYMGV